MIKNKKQLEVTKKKIESLKKQLNELEEEVSEYKRISSLPKSAIDKLMEDESFVKTYRDWERASDEDFDDTDMHPLATEVKLDE